jgi:uncharacterized membrane protein YgcG
MHLVWGGGGGWGVNPCHGGQASWQQGCLQCSAARCAGQLSYGRRCTLCYGRWCTLCYGRWCTLCYGRWCTLCYGRWCTLCYGSWCMLCYGCWCTLCDGRWCTHLQQVAHEGGHPLEPRGVQPALHGEGVPPQVQLCEARQAQQPRRHLLHLVVVHLQPAAVSVETVTLLRNSSSSSSGFGGSSSSSSSSSGSGSSSSSSGSGSSSRRSSSSSGGAP